MPFGWYVVYTRHQHEKSAAQLLIRKGLEVLLPLYRSRSRWSDRTQVVHLPLFPNYLFVQCDLESRVQVLQTAGVCWFLGNAGVPSAIREEEISTIRRMAGSPLNVQPHDYLEHGDRVRVLRGPLAGLTGTLTRVKNQYRVVVSVELLRKSAAVEIDLSDVERESSPRRSGCQPQADSQRPARMPGAASRHPRFVPLASEFSYGK